MLSSADAAYGRVVHATVSTALRDCMLGPPSPVTLIAAVTGAIYLRHKAGNVLAVVGADSARLPMAAVLSAPAAMGTLGHLPVGTTGQIGTGRLRVGSVTVSLRSWWEPRPILGPIALSAATLPDVDPVATGLPVSGLVALGDLTRAVRHRDAAAIIAAAGRLIGLGPGLTPAGDDVVTGLIGALVCLNDPLAPRITGQIVAAAAGRTTVISEALLEHAAAGRCYGEVADLLVALTGGLPVQDASQTLQAVGASSGPALAYGVGLAVHTAAGSVSGRVA